MIAIVTKPIIHGIQTFNPLVGYWQNISGKEKRNSTLVNLALILYEDKLAN
jgi:hypothetical protein